MILQSLIINSVMALVLVSSPSSDTPQKRENAHKDFSAFVQDELNPHSNDYGREVQTFAEITFQQTLANAYFWFTAISLGGSGSLSLYIAHLIQQRKRREVISAKLLAWYHNELVTAREALSTIVATLTASESANGISEHAADTSAETLGELNRLRQQVMTQAASERILKGQINTLTKKLNEERQKNKSMKVE